MFIFPVECMLNLFTEVFSDAGSSSFEKEQLTYVFFRDVLEEIERKYTYILTSRHALSVLVCSIALVA